MAGNEVAPIHSNASRSLYTLHAVYIFSNAGALVVTRVKGVSNPLITLYPSYILLRSPSAYSKSVFTFPHNIYIGIHATV